MTVSISNIPQPVEPHWPTIKSCIPGFDWGERLRPFKEDRDTLPFDITKNIRAELCAKGVQQIRLAGGLDVSTLGRPWVVNSGGPEITAENPRETDAFIQKIGTRYGFHMTDAFSFSLMRGHWLRGLKDVLNADIGEKELSEVFHMASGTSWDRGRSRLQDYSPEGRGGQLYKALVEHGFSIPVRARPFAHVGVLLAIDLQGYRHFQSNQSPYLGFNSGIIGAPCPPPPQFVKPIAVL